MKNIIIKGIIVFAIFIMLMNIFSMNTYAALTIDGIKEAGDSFLNAGTEGTGHLNQDRLSGLSNFVSGVLLTIALGVTLISGVVMGISFMVQSVEDKAKIKESMIPWIIGIIISFGAYGIWKIALGIFGSL